ncbi:MAG: hypothetical protein EOM76_00100 [Sphingobacteriia bacterium]|jgi:polysaccharide biosynthesis/export protein|nr:polysaccharide biosynthesis/export family protein [Paludibacteraceae bacterium]NCA78591.1 hypothetical protein [Sphingobacteriia bacterium]
MKKLKYIIFGCVLALSLFSCMTTKKVNYLQSGKHIPEYADTLIYTDYKLQKGDYIYIRVYTLDEESQRLFNGNTNNNNVQQTSDNAYARLYFYLIGEDGCINYPYVGKIKLLGLESREAKVAVEDKLQNMLHNFSIDVRLMNRTFSVIGESGSGRYQIPKEKLNIFQALAMSGDMSTYSDRSKIQLIRQTEEGTVVKSFDLRSKSIINSEFYYIQPNDVIYVPFDGARYFGVTHFTGILSLVISTLSFGLLIYGLCKP